MNVRNKTIVRNIVVLPLLFFRVPLVLLAKVCSAVSEVLTSVSESIPALTHLPSSVQQQKSQQKAVINEYFKLIQK